MNIKRNESFEKHLYLKLTIFLIIFLLILYFGTMKNGLNVDEVYTYGLSNSFFEPFLKFPKENKVDFTFFHEYLTTQNGERFRFDSVYSNQTLDVHPPLYYMLIHFISSLFPGEFSKWIGIGVNISLLPAILFFYFRLSEKILGKNFMMFIPILFWGVSASAMSSFMFIRMYTLLTLISIISVYIHVSLIEKTYKKKMWIFLFLVSLFGFLTHYYYVIFAFFLSLSFLIVSLVEKKWKKSFIYSITMFFSLGFFVFLYPSVINHIFYGYRGQQAFESIDTTSSNVMIEFISGLKEYLLIINQILFFDKSLTILIFFFIIFVIFLFRRKNLNRNKLYDLKFVKHLILLLLPSLFYTLVISKVAPYYADRYIFIVIPFLSLLFVLVYTNFFSIVSNKRLYLWVFSLLLILGQLYNTVTNQSVNYLYDNRNTAELRKLSQPFDEVIFTYDANTVKEAQLTNSSQYLLYHDTIWIIDDSKLIEMLNMEFEMENRVLLYLGYALNLEETAQSITINTDFKSFEILNESTGTIIIKK